MILSNFFFGRNLVDDWMEHYRLAIGMSSPHLRSMQDKPGWRNRHTQSAKSPGGRVILESAATSVPRPDISLRVPSAPVGKEHQDTN